MSLNIKNEETHRLAQELATLTGQSMSAAVTEAVREKLQRIKNQGMAARIMKIARESAALLNGKPLPGIDELLYDEKGLPK
ncbi:MAG TPA: type II toxin-antitoxin system VapB family antitoxin [Terriglobales bacterium]